jgi:hypothetical protein
MTWGTTKFYDLTVTEPSGAAIDLTGKDVVFEARAKFADEEPLFVCSTDNGQVTLKDVPAKNVAVIRIAPENTSALPRSKTSKLKFQVVMAAPPDRFELKAGDMLITPSVTELE